MKVRDSCSEDSDRSSIPSRPAASKSAQPPVATASDILGLKRKQTTGRQAVSLELEVDQYLSNPNSGTSILEFWQVVLIRSIYIHMYDFTNLWPLMQEHQHQYPRIFRLAMDIIPIQASSVPCERVFSSGKETMTPQRSRISAQLMEALQILKFSIRKKSKDSKDSESSLKFSDMTWKEELMEFERLARSAPPGDAEAYGRNLEEEKEESDDVSEMDEEEINSEVLGEQMITPELNEDDGADEDEEMYL